MTECDERRVHGIQRVPVATLVEICGNQPGIPAFEAQSLDVSGRGMHVKTAYVPKVGDPLVCRFESQGQEIVVEGVVAWRREGETGGDFGIEFTALDSNSVDALRSLCGVRSADPEQAEAEGDCHEAGRPEAGVCASGARVRLHIDGLGSPMKANVREGSRRRLHVGSQLQFLQVGRHLEVEDVGAGARRHARIDSVDVRVDPRTQVPELVVTLRYEGVEDCTPQPSVVDRSPADPLSAAEPALREAGQSSRSIDDPDEAAALQAEAEMLAEQQAAEQARLAYDRLGHAAEGAAEMAKVTGRTLARLGYSAALGAKDLFKGASSQIRGLGKAGGQPPPRRQTAPPPAGGRSFPTAKLRAQAGARAGAPRSGNAATHSGQPPVQAGVGASSSRRRVTKLGVLAGGLVVIGATTAYALRDVDGEAAGQNPPAVAAAAPASAAQKPPSPKTAEKAQGSEDGIVANVPLFGPTPLATMEPAPLGEAPDPEDEEAAEKAAAAAAVEDATWSDDSAPKSAAVDPKDVKPWGRGRMHLPTIHKLRLDAPGSSISGSVNATGFTVVIPGRKVMESGRAIQRRDKRIAQVKTSNTAQGAQLTFQFRDKVPPYRVRLRNDFAEILISAPES